MAWTVPVVDRTQTDINNKTSKAYMQSTDLNRIGNNIQYINDNLIIQGYYSGAVGTVNWQSLSKFITLSQTDNILTQVNKLIFILGVLNTTPALPSTFNKINFEGINNIEKTLLDLRVKLDYMAANQNYLGCYEMGE